MNKIWILDMQNHEYTTYGEVTTASSTPVLPYRYTSEQHDDETGLIYLRARYYDPALGRFISRDSFRGTLDSSLSQHSYQYGLNNPVRYSDPSGEWVWVVGALIEAGFSIYDGYNVYKALTDPCASASDKAYASSFFMAGIIGPGGGYNAIGNVWTSGSKGSQVIDGVKYSDHALDAMLPVGFGGRGIPPSVVKNAITNGIKESSTGNRTVHIYENVKVVTEADGTVVTVIKIGH